MTVKKLENLIRTKYPDYMVNLYKKHNKPLVHFVLTDKIKKATLGTGNIPVETIIFSKYIETDFQKIRILKICDKDDTSHDQELSNFIENVLKLEQL